MGFELVEMNDLRVAAVPHTGAWEKIGAAFEKLEHWVQKAELKSKGLVAIYPVTNKEPAWAGVVVDEAVAIPRALTARRVPGGRYAQTIHKGPLDGLPKAWEAFRAELRGYHPIAPRPLFELYKNPQAMSVPEKLRTDLFLPLCDAVAARPQPLLVVNDVRASSRWYQELLGAESGHGGEEYERLNLDGALVLQLHSNEEEHHHGRIADPNVPRGNGVAVWFEVKDLDAMARRAKRMKATLDTPLRENKAAKQRELWLRDLDGYLVVLAGR